jgi:hypothetical protein
LGVRVEAGAGNFSLHHRIQNGSDSHPALYLVGIRALSLGVKLPGHEADHSPPSSAEVKECVELFFNSPIRLHDVVAGCTLTDEIGGRGIRNKSDPLADRNRKDMLLSKFKGNLLTTAATTTATGKVVPVLN